MSTDFQFSATFHGAQSTPAIRVIETRGASIATSPDSAITVVLLGNDKDTAVATRIAQQCAERPPSPASLPTGYAVIAIIDQPRARITLVTPPIGLRQVFWSTSENEFSVGSHPLRLGCLAGHRPAIRPEALFQYMYFHMIPGPDCVYDGIFKLQAGHRLDWDGSAARTERYWRPSFSDSTSIAEDEASRQLHELLRRAVGRSLDQSATAGAFLSGGLDSSTVAGVAAGMRPGVHTVSMGFDAQGYDEMEYARIASRRFGTTPLEYYVTPEDVLATLPEILAAFPEPFGNSSAAAAYQCARVAREHGLTLLLAGDGGDELFGGNDRYARQLVFERYSRIPHVLRFALLEPAVNAASRVTQAFPIGKAASYIAQAKVPLPDRLQTYNFLHRIDPVEVFTSELLDSVDRAAPIRMLRDEYGTPATHSAVNRMLFLDWRFTLHDNDLVKVNTMCHLAGVDVAYPMLDQDLVDFSLRLPADWKVRNGQLRWFYKRAMTGFLPNEIINKTKHGFGLPFGVWTRTHAGLRRLSEDALSTLSERNFFRPAFLREALRLHSEGHASYYGELVWILTVLELWLRTHAPTARL